jgi:hypothetical protein
VRVTLPSGIEPDQLKNAAIAVLVVLVIVLFLVMRFIQKMVFRVIMVGLLIAGGVALYSQRANLDDCQKRVRAEMTATSADVRCVCTFAGMDVTVPDCPFARQPGE